MSELIQGIYTDGSGAHTLVPVAVDAAGQLLGVGGGGGGGGAAAAAINTTAATPVAQTILTIAAGNKASYVVPATCRCLTICITSGSLVHYTENGAEPTTENCWFGYGSKEIWDMHIPQGATIKLLAVAAATISFQARNAP